MSYKTSNAEGPVDFINTYDLEPMAQQVIPKAAFGYIASGAEDTFTLRENIRAFNHKLIVPHTLCNVENPSTEIEFAGEKLSSPIIMAPVAAHKLANEQGEVATARGVHEFGSLYTTSSYSTVDLPEITEALQGTPHWFQFYFSKDDGINRHIMDRVKAEGYKAIVLTADATVGGNREVDKRNGFVFPVGMPIVEALTSGTPVVASDIPVLREAGGRAALYAQPKNPDDFSKKILSIISDPSARNKMHKSMRNQIQKISWEKNVDILIRSFREALNKS